MKIRLSNLADIHPLAELFDQYRVWYHKDSDIESAIKFLTARMQNKESIVFIAETENNSLVGFTQLYPLFSSTRMKRLWLLNDLFVAPDYRAKGISKLLIEAAKNHCRQTGACAMTLETGKDNDIGNQLYPSSGFELNTDYNFYEWTCE